MKIGFLPLYIALYDEISTEYRDRMEPFYETLAQELEKRGAQVVRSPFCRIKEEFQRTVALFKKEEVDAIVTLHLAYSPSLEALDSLLDADLPIIVMDTTETLTFTNEQDPDHIMYNHGIHGVMDLCSMLNRHGKPYAIAAGHWQESDCLDQVCGYVRAAISAKAISRARVGLIGGSFAGMGDFRVPFGEMKERFGITVVEADREEICTYLNELTPEQLDAERAANAALCDISGEIIEEEYVETLRSCLATHRFIAEKKLTAFSANFMRIGAPNTGIAATPFLEACRAMERGIGYAGEGDALTAAFCGALLESYKDTSFVEIFCPDWKNNLLFLSHMGEVNYRIADTKPFLHRAAKYGKDDVNPYIGFVRMKGGHGVYVNISRSEYDYRLLLAPAEMQSYDHDTIPLEMRGWMRPDNGTTASFLADLSRNGATHHSIFVYGATVEELTFFGQLLDMEVVVI